MLSEQKNSGFRQGESAAGMTVRDVLYVLLRHKKAMALFFVVFVCAGTVAILLMPSVYHSEAQVLVKVGRSPLTRDPEISVPQVDGSPNEVQNAMAIMQSESVAENIVEKLGPETILRPAAPHSFPARVLARLRRAGKAAGGESPYDEETIHRYATTAVVESLQLKALGNIIRMSYNAQDPYLARTILSDLLDFYLQKHVEVYTAQVSPEFFAREATKAQEDLAQKESEVEEFRKKHNVTSLEDQRKVALDTVSQIQANLRDTNAEIGASKARINSYEEQLSVMGVKKDSETGQPLVQPAPSAYVGELKQRLLDLRVRESEAERRYPDGALPLEDIRDQIRITQEAMNSEARDAPAAAAMGGTVAGAGGDAPGRNVVSLLETERAQLDGHQARATMLSSQLQAAEKVLEPFREVETTLKRLTLERDVLEDRYVEFRRNLERSRITSTLDREKVSNVKVIQSPTLILDPILPNRHRNFALVLFVAFFGAIATAFALEYLDQTLKTNDDVAKHLGLPVLTTVTEEEFKSCI
ncbi:hypothetical protein JW916_16015 [Candidatus Sumerlaeota bacterium]|nr:hypothetical protein [Candidatus Sumerlaeota bacterium]